MTSECDCVERTLMADDAVSHPREFDPTWSVTKMLTLLKRATPYKTVEQSGPSPQSP